MASFNKVNYHLLRLPLPLLKSVLMYTTPVMNYQPERLGLAQLPQLRGRMESSLRRWLPRVLLKTSNSQAAPFGCKWL